MEQFVAYIFLGIITLALGIFISYNLISEFSYTRAAQKILLTVLGGGFLLLAVFLFIKAYQHINYL